MHEARTRAPDEPGPARQTVNQATQATGEAAGNVADTAKEQARQVTGEVRQQARGVAADVRDRVTEQAQTQNDRLAHGMRRLADELEEMAADRKDSPARAVVSRIADGSRQMAGYLADRGPQGVLDEVQEFARRRPGAFLLTAAVAGFVVGRLGKSVLNATGGAGGTRSAYPQGGQYATPSGQYATPSFRSPTPEVTETPLATDTLAGAGTYPTGTGASAGATGYPATGTGTSAGATGYPTGTGTSAGATGYATGTGTSAGTIGYPTGTPVGSTEYASTGTGTPLPVNERYPGESVPPETTAEPLPPAEPEWPDEGRSR